MKKHSKLILMLLVMALVFALAAPSAFATAVSGAINVDPVSPNVYRVGDTIDYVMTLRNDSTVDDYLVDRVWFVEPDGVTEHTFATNIVIAPGVTNTYNYSYVVDAADLFVQVGGLDAGLKGVQSTFRAEGFQGVDEAEVLVRKTSTIIDPAIDIEKYTNGEDADDPTGPEIEVGAPVEWTYVVTNTGDCELVNVVVTDDKEGEIGIIASLAAGESQTLTAPLGTAELGQYANIADVVGTPAVRTFEFPEWNVTDSDPSHYFGVLPALQVTKTAEASYDRTVEWTLEKKVNGEDEVSFTGPAGSYWDVTWQISGTKNVTEDNYAISGTISITNPALFASQNFDVADVLDDGTDVVLSETSGEVGPGETVVINYSAEPVDDSATMNTATVTPEFGDPVIDEAEVNFVMNLIGVEEGTLTDDRFDDFLEVVDDDFSFEIVERFVCEGNFSEYSEGSWTETYVNTAFLNGEIELEDDASVTITCELPALEVTKTAEASYDRTVTWELEKTVDGVKLVEFSGMAGDVFGPVEWEVIATKTTTEDNFYISGTITIFNPAAVPQDYSVIDELDDGTSVDLLGPAPAAGTIDPGETLYIDYEASPTDASATLNTATVSAAGNPDQVATAPIVWDVTESGDDEVELADDRFDGSPETISASTTWTYLESFECSADEEMYEDGYYEAEFPNTATLTGPTTDLESSAKVTIECEFPDDKCYADETAWAYGEYDGVNVSNPNWDYVNNRFWGWTNGPLSDGFYAEWPLYAGAGQNDLDKGEIVGWVTVDYSNGCVEVIYQVDEGYYLGEVHLWVGNDVLPEVTRGRTTVYTNAPGQFPYKDYFGFDPEDSDTWEIEWHFYECGFEGDIYIAAHAVVWMEVECPEENDLY